MMTPRRSSGCGACISELTTHRHRGRSQAPWTIVMLVVVVVVVFFTLTDRASTIPSNTRGCQSGTWSAGQKKIRGTSTNLQ